MGDMNRLGENHGDKSGSGRTGRIGGSPTSELAKYTDLKSMTKAGLVYDRFRPL